MLRLGVKNSVVKAGLPWPTLLLHRDEQRFSSTNQQGRPNAENKRLFSDVFLANPSQAPWLRGILAHHHARARPPTHPPPTRPDRRPARRFGGADPHPYRFESCGFASHDSCQPCHATSSISTSSRIFCPCLAPTRPPAGPAASAGSSRGDQASGRPIRRRKNRETPSACEPV